MSAQLDLAQTRLPGTGYEQTRPFNVLGSMSQTLSSLNAKRGSTITRVSKKSNAVVAVETFGLPIQQDISKRPSIILISINSNTNSKELVQNKKMVATRARASTCMIMRDARSCTVLRIFANDVLEKSQGAFEIQAQLQENHRK